MANLVYNRGKRDIAKAIIDLDGGTLTVALMKSAYTANADDQTMGGISANELSVGGYARQTLAGRSIVEDDVNDFAYLTGTNVTFAALAAGQTIGGAVLVDTTTGVDATSPLIAFYDTIDTATTGVDFVVVWATVANGNVLKLA